MDLFELQQLDVLLRKLCEDKEIMGGLSLLERGQITAASETVCSLNWQASRSADEHARLRHGRSKPMTAL